MYDVVIIGAGVSGCAAARELARYRLNICVLEKEEDVCSGTSKANSGIVHAGYDAMPGSLKAELNRRGNEMMDALAEELDIPFKRIGSLVTCPKGKENKLEELLEKGKKNGVPRLKIIRDIDTLRKMEPNLSEHIVAALYAPTAGIICPFSLNLALAENAYENGVEFRFDSSVEKITRTTDGYVLELKSERIETKCIVNAAGIYGDVFHNMVSMKKIHITARKGEYCLLDKNAGTHVSHVVFSLPEEKGKGVLVTPTIHGNLLLGPTAVDVMNKEGVNTTAQGIEEVLNKAERGVSNIPFRQIITSFAGLRAHEDGNDFIIQEVEDAPGFVDCVGIESPGLTSCPAIGERVAGIVSDILKPERKENFRARRKTGPNLEHMTIEERNALIRENPAYGTIVCRCEMVSEGEIVDAIRGPLGARSLDGIKRRTRAGMGRCQSGFCSPKVMDILRKELGIGMLEVTKSGGESKMVVGISKPEGGRENEKV